MSTNIRVSTELYAWVQRELGVSCEVGLSGRLHATAATLQTTGLPSSMTLGVMQEPGVAELAAQLGRGAELSSLLTPVGSAATVSRDSAALLSALGDHLDRVERDAVGTLARSVLEAEGYQVRAEAGEVATGIEAYRGDAVFLLAIQGGGEMLIDQAGEPDCASSMAAFEAGMEQAGARVTRVADVPHDPDQGPLIAQAAASGAPNLAAGIARHATRRRGGRTDARAGTSRTEVTQVITNGRVQR